MHLGVYWPLKELFEVQSSITNDQHFVQLFSYATLTSYLSNRSTPSSL
jgi:hypothetical protein